MQAILGEFIGTLILILLGDGVCAAVNLNKSKAHQSGWIVIAFGWSLAVTIAVYISSFMGPAHLNPAVTLAMAIKGATPWEQVIPFILAQVVGAVVGAILVWVAYYLQFKETTEQGAILGTFATGAELFNPIANIATEVIGTFVLVLTLLSFSLTSFADGVNVFAVGAVVLAIGLSLGGPTGYAINPARDFGPRLAHAFLPIENKGDSNWSYAFIPIVGPVIGSLLAVFIFQIIQ